MQQFKKKIGTLKLSITTACNLRCEYCFVDKNNKTMDFLTARKAIDLLTQSSGKEKLLKIYGGEPLLCFRLLKRIIGYAINRAHKDGKRITVTPCTNAVLLNREQLIFFKKHNIRLAISFDGDIVSHNKFRKYPNAKKTYNDVCNKIPLAVDILGKENVAINLGVTPFSAKKLFENFVNLTKKSVNTVNIEIIQHFHLWYPSHFKIFILNIEKIIKYIFVNIKHGEFFFLTTINREMKYSELSKFNTGECGFSNCLEIYPSGEMAFSSFLLNVKNRQEYMIGNINRGYIKEKYRDCTYRHKSYRCKKCISDYYLGFRSDNNASRLLEFRNRISIIAAKYIFNQARRNKLFKRYIIEAKKHICF